MKPGIYDCIDNATYHGGPGESKSLLDHMRNSPAHYRAVTTPAANDEPPPPRKPTPAQEFGTAFHALILEPHEFAKTYCLALRPSDLDYPVVVSKDELLAMVAELNATRKAKLPTSGSKDELIARLKAEVAAEGWETPLEDLKTADLKALVVAHNETRQGLLSATGTMEALAQTLRDAGRAVTLWDDVKAEWLRNNSQRIVLSLEVWQQLHRMRDAVMAHPTARALLSKPGVAERSVYWTDPATGLLCRCRPDWWITQEGIVVDVKTTDDASPEGFARSIAKWRYHVQDPFYTDGINAMRKQYRPEGLDLPMPAKVRAFLFLAVEKDACVVDGVALGVAVYRLDDAGRDLGRVEYRADLERIAECKRAGRFPGYGDAVLGIELPRWKQAQAANEADDAPARA